MHCCVLSLFLTSHIHSDIFSYSLIHFWLRAFRVVYSARTSWSSERWRIKIPLIHFWIVVLFLSTNAQNPGAHYLSISNKRCPIDLHHIHWGRREKEKERDPLCQHPVWLFIRWTALPMDIQCYQCCIQCHGLQLLSHLMGLLGNNLGWHHQHILIQQFFISRERTQPPFLHWQTAPLRKPSQNLEINTEETVLNKLNILLMDLCYLSYKLKEIKRNTPLHLTLSVNLGYGLLWMKHNLVRSLAWFLKGTEISDALVKVVSKKTVVKPPEPP